MTACMHVIRRVAPASTQQRGIVELALLRGDVNQIWRKVVHLQRPRVNFTLPGMQYRSSSAKQLKSADGDAPEQMKIS